MTRTVTVVVSCLAVLNLTGSSPGRADDQEAKELKRLEGVWTSTPAKKGRDRGHVFVFQGGRMAWRSFQTLDGEPVIGHTKLYEIRVDPKALPQQITATLGEDENRETRQCIYKLDGDTLKIALSTGPDGKRPKKFEDEGAQVITLAREKEAKIPDLSKVGKRGKESEIDPTAQWVGRVRDAGIAKKCPKTPITTRAEFEAVWKALRGAEGMPKIDFEKEFALVRTSTFGDVTAIKLRVFEGEEGTDEYVFVESKDKEKVEGFTYAIGTFRRELVDVVDGRIIAKGPKK